MISEKVWPLLPPTWALAGRAPPPDRAAPPGSLLRGGGELHRAQPPRRRILHAPRERDPPGPQAGFVHAIRARGGRWAMCAPCAPSSLLRSPLPLPTAPENILMTDSGDMNSIKVADFGLSKSFRQGDEPEDMRMTQFCGTMSFMAPELFAEQPLYRCAHGGRHLAAGSLINVRPPCAQQSSGCVELRRHRVPAAHGCVAALRRRHAFGQ